MQVVGQGAGWGRARRWRGRSLVVLVAGWVAAGCGERPTITVQIQGTVRTLGLQTPVTGAQVTVQWPAALGGGESSVRTNAAGQYVAQRTVRQRDVSCQGVAVSAEAPTFATAYTRYSEDTCGEGALTLDFTLYPIPR